MGSALFFEIVGIALQGMVSKGANDSCRLGRSERRKGFRSEMSLDQAGLALTRADAQMREKIGKIGSSGRPR
jgi:hypothetical protein